MEAFRPRLRAAGLSQDNALELWFATTLRDGIAISASGGFASFRDIASNSVKQLLAKTGHSGDSEQAAADVIKGFEEVQAHSDVLPGLRAIHDAGIKVCTMTNGSKEVTRRFLNRSKLDFVSPVLDVEGSKAWKPCKAAYQYVLDQLGMSPEQVMLVAVHPWDCNGAKAAGLKAAFIAREGQRYPDSFLAPDYTASSLEDLAQQLRA
ncbi:g11945 [Coccomyxa viridis]|uniref:G11945 protein n=1 Tax=Coccomyxa viridis TaxID=1274662 RepID=A0ABP1GES8_9CHLO